MPVWEATDIEKYTYTLNAIKLWFQTGPVGTWRRILVRSRGATDVFDSPPAIPPASSSWCKRNNNDLLHYSPQLTAWIIFSWCHHETINHNNPVAVLYTHPHENYGTVPVLLPALTCHGFLESSLTHLSPGQTEAVIEASSEAGPCPQHEETRASQLEFLW